MPRNLPQWGSRRYEGEENHQLKEWTRTQTIRTVAQIPFEVAILETAEPPTYQRIAPQARRLSQLGLPALRIAQARSG